ncbi:hypothetical protein Q5P01_003740 [Channa striata]|uniref:Uncharacterized protein n=1 Tax=Channa striata TaxID=64152 RepID=A0AA88NMG8_CHASR|nr:hypothetical protein Q5P01_003740 [Channa striata]
MKTCLTTQEQFGIAPKKRSQGIVEGSTPEIQVYHYYRLFVEDTRPKRTTTWAGARYLKSSSRKEGCAGGSQLHLPFQILKWKDVDSEKESRKQEQCGQSVTAQTPAGHLEEEGEAPGLPPPLPPSLPAWLSQRRSHGDGDYVTT